MARPTRPLAFIFIAILLCVAACRPPRDASGSRADGALPDGSPADADRPDGYQPPDDGSPPRDTAPPDPNRDFDGDGHTVAGGDCDDYEANINPMAFEVPDNVRDDDCDGDIDEAPDECDCAGGELDLAVALGLCDDRFLLAVEERFESPRGDLGFGTSTHYGSSTNDLDVREGCAYTILSTGTVDLADCEYDSCPGGRRESGTDFYNFPADWMSLGCMGGESDPAIDRDDGAIICDTVQLVVSLRAPSNASGFSFDFIYMSAEYPEYVDLGYNDTFYAILRRPDSGERQNISFDESGSEIEVDNTFFEDPPVTDLAGTGYEGECEIWDEDGWDSYWGPCASSTGWLRTSWEVLPGEEITLTFSIHDEGDGVLDSAVILDNFAWSLNPVEPGTDLI